MSKPNEWSKTVGAATRRIESEALTDTKQMQLAFWEDLHAELRSHPSIRTQKPRPQHWTNLPIGRSGMRLGAILNTKEERLGVELYLGDENALAFFRELEAQKSEIEAALGFAPVWKALPDKRASRIIFYRQGCPLDDRERWPDYRAWLTEHLETFDRVFRPRVKVLDPDKFQEAAAEEGEVT